MDLGLQHSPCLKNKLEFDHQYRLLNKCKSIPNNHREKALVAASIIYRSVWLIGRALRNQNPRLMLVLSSDRVHLGLKV